MLQLIPRLQCEGTHGVYAFHSRTKLIASYQHALITPSPKMIGSDVEIKKSKPFVHMVAGTVRLSQCLASCKAQLCNISQAQISSQIIYDSKQAVQELELFNPQMRT